MAPPRQNESGTVPPTHGIMRWFSFRLARSIPIMTSSTLADALRSATTRLSMHDSARLDAELLLAKVLGQTRSYLCAWPERLLSELQAQEFDALVARRAAGEPVAHILGRREFWSLDIEVTSATLIPRPDTELLVELALTRIPVDAAWRILDLGTGTGAIALALAHERPCCQVEAGDVSAAALAVATRNVQRLDMTNVRLYCGSWFQPFTDQRFDVIVSNPPYIRADDPHLQQGDVRFDPRSALLAGQDGLRDLRFIISGAPAHLHSGGWLLVEHGYDQETAVAEMFARAGFTAIETARDLGGRPRVSYGRWPSVPEERRL